MITKKFKATSTGAISELFRAPMGVWRLLEVTVKLSAAATTGSQDLDIAIDNEEGAAYDIVLLSTEMVADGGTDKVWNSAGGYILDGGGLDRAGDQVKITFPNTDARTIGIIAWMEKLGDAIR
jgi:hypothetical protein